MMRDVWSPERSVSTRIQPMNHRKRLWAQRAVIGVRDQMNADAIAIDEQRQVADANDLREMKGSGIRCGTA